MKRRFWIGCCMLLLCLTAPFAGLAQTQEEWNLSCHYKLSTSSDVYSQTLEGYDDYSPYYVTTLPANTYVKKGGGTILWNRITWMANGTTQSGYVLTENLTRCVSDVYTDGDKENYAPVSELDPNHDDIVNTGTVLGIAPSLMQSGERDYSQVTYATPLSYIDQAIQSASTEQEKWDLSCMKKTSTDMTVYKTGVDGNEVLMTIPAGTYVKIQDTALTWQTIDFMIDGIKYHGRTEIGGVTDAAIQVTGANGLPDNVHELDPRYNAIVSGELKVDNATAAGTTVKLQELGTVTSKVQSEGETVEVKTADLVFSDDVPADKKVAVIYAPRTGKATMRANASEDADYVKKCKAGTVVSVLEIGNRFTLINYDGTVGYVLTDCLQFHNPADEPQGSAMISYKGKTNGSTTANIRNKPDKDSAKVATWKTGTEVIILSYKDGWYEVEANGIRGFVMEEYVTTK